MNLPQPVASVCLALGITGAVAADPLSIYMIGNSHTADSEVRRGLPDLLAQAGFSPTLAHHIRCGWSLHEIATDPSNTCIDPVPEFGDLTQALVNHDWDVITIQPHDGGTIAEELAGLEAVLNFLPADAQPRVFLYVNWPMVDWPEERVGKHRASVPFETQWNAPLSATSDPTLQSYRFFFWFYQQMRAADIPASEISYIPIGCVLAELYQRIDAGAFPGLSDPDILYRDGLHMSALGKYVTGLTFVASVYGYDVRQLGAPPENPAYQGARIYPSDPLIPIDKAMADFFQEVVWEVVQSDPLAPENLPHRPRVVTEQGAVRFRWDSFLGAEYRIREGTDLGPLHLTDTASGSGNLMERPAPDNADRWFWQLVVD
ncbi:MAG: hypothetical protein ACFB21_03005 [Opitutales bacterium]